MKIDTQSPNAFAVAFGFIAGYFSDRAAAKLSEVAYLLFGTADEQTNRKFKELESKIEDLKSKVNELTNRLSDQTEAGDSAESDAGEAEEPRDQ